MAHFQAHIRPTEGQAIHVFLPGFRGFRPQDLDNFRFLIASGSGGARVSRLKPTLSYGLRGNRAPWPSCGSAQPATPPAHTGRRSRASARWQRPGSRARSLSEHGRTRCKDRSTRPPRAALQSTGARGTRGPERRCTHLRCPMRSLARSRVRPPAIWRRRWSMRC